MKPAPFAIAVVTTAMAFLPAVAAAAKPATYTIVIRDMRFRDMPATLHVGDRIRWINRDIFQHSATARDHSFDLELAVGAQRSIVLRRRGRIDFFCRYHPGMAGALLVR